jgi:hypothetical protein
VSVHVDADREIVRVVSGDHAHYYPDAVAFAREAFLAPLPEGADVVISNAYPIDVSLTFMRSKGMIPLVHAAPSASRILVSACPEGVGHHGLFPIVPSASRYRYRHMARRARARPAALPAKLARRAARSARLLHASPPGSGAPAPDGDATAPIEFPVWLYAPETEPGALPINLPGMTALYSWEEILRRVADEQAGRDRIRVAVYPCAPLQVLDLARVPSPPAPLGAVD